MSSVATKDAAPARAARNMSARAQALAVRLEEGANALASFAAGLNDTQWQTRIPHDGRKIGVVVHHVASMYPIEIHAAQIVSRGEALPVTWQQVHEINAAHATEHDATSKAEAIDLLRKNAAAAAEAIRALSDEELDRAAPVEFADAAPMTCQFVLEDHAVRHSYHHLAVVRRALK